MGINICLTQQCYLQCSFWELGRHHSCKVDDDTKKNFTCVCKFTVNVFFQCHFGFYNKIKNVHDKLNNLISFFMSYRFNKMKKAFFLIKIIKRKLFIGKIDRKKMRDERK